MVLYVFEHGPSGDTIEVDYPMTEAPKVGAKVRRYGRQWTRIPTLATAKPRVWSREFKAVSLPLWHPDAPRHDSDGTPCFTSQREVDEFCAKTGMGYE